MGDSASSFEGAVAVWCQKSTSDRHSGMQAFEVAQQCPAPGKYRPSEPHGSAAISPVSLSVMLSACKLYSRQLVQLSGLQPGGRSRSGSGAAAAAGGARTASATAAAAAMATACRIERMARLFRGC
jgi:hypothetical protein